MRNLAQQLQDSTTEKGAITGHCQMTKAGCLPLLPLSPLSASSSFFGLRMRLRKEHKLRSLSSILHRRSRSISVLINKSPSPSKHQDEVEDQERSTMSLCSVTSDDYDLEDTMMMDTLDVDFIVESGYYQSPTTTRDGRRSYHHHGAHHDGITSPPTVPRVASSTLSSVWITPPTPARLTLKMRPSVFLDHDDDYHHHHHNDELIHGNDRFCHTMDDDDDDDDLQIHEGDDDRPSHCPVLIRSESVSFDHDDGAVTDDENTAPPPLTSPPTTPLPSWYPEAATNHLTSPPMIRSIPKNTVHLPFQSLDNDFNINGGDRRRRRRHVSIDMDDEDRTLSHPTLHHLLLPDDF